MQGEYRGDFTRDTFDPVKRYSQVLMQQGRVILDGDWNEQGAILTYYLRALATDLIGPYWGPKQFQGQDNHGFEITLTANPKNDFLIGRGRYYVNGILCESNGGSYMEQIDLPLKDDEKVLNKSSEVITCLVYLDVWERHVTAMEDGSIREVALGGPDTSTRAQVVWQVKIDNVTAKNTGQGPLVTLANKLITNTAASDLKPAAEAYLRTRSEGEFQTPNAGLLLARAKKKDKPNEPCAISPESGYRGIENHLYRVEVHRAGKVWDGNDANIGTAATFKWSRDNGSTVFEIRSLAGNTVMLSDLGPDTYRSLQIDDYVEVVDDVMVSRGEAGILRQVKSIDQLEMSVTLKDGPGTLPNYNEDNPNHPRLRRWDHRDDGHKQSALVLQESVEGETGWIELEDGIEIKFLLKTGSVNTYRRGDYWLIPARVAGGDVQWPKDSAGKLVPQSPHGVQHQYAPLWLINVKVDGTVALKTDCRTLMS